MKNVLHEQEGRRSSSRASSSFSELIFSRVFHDQVTAREDRNAEDRGQDQEHQIDPPVESIFLRLWSIKDREDQDAGTYD